MSAEMRRLLALNMLLSWLMGPKRKPELMSAQMVPKL